MRAIYKLAMFILIFNLAAYAVAAVSGAPVNVAQGDLSQYDTGGLANTAQANAQTATNTSITGWFYTIPALSDLLTLLSSVVYVEGILVKPPFNLGFTIAPGMTFAHAIQLLIWFVYGAAIIEVFLHTKITRGD